MSILSVDLACRRWSDLGIVVLRRSGGSPAGAGPFAEPAGAGSSRVDCEILPWAGPDGSPHEPLDAEILAGRLNHECGARGIRVLMLDGPQAWKSESNGLLHARISERLLNTAAKTGLPGQVKPATYRTFAEFCIDVYDALCRRGWRRLASCSEPGRENDRVLVESYPYAAWRALGLQPLAAKRRAHISHLAAAYTALQSVAPFTVNRPPNHDQLQAIVGGLAGLALEARREDEARIVGTAPRREDGHWREGFIVVPVLPQRTVSVRWLN